MTALPARLFSLFNKRRAIYQVFPAQLVCPGAQFVLRIRYPVTWDNQKKKLVPRPEHNRQCVTRWCLVKILDSQTSVLSCTTQAYPCDFYITEDMFDAEKSQFNSALDTEEISRFRFSFDLTSPCLCSLCSNSSSEALNPNAFFAESPSPILIDANTHAGPGLPYQSLSAKPITPHSNL